MKLAVFGALIILSAGAQPAQAATPSSIRSLVGVGNVRLVVEDLNQATQQTGLRKEHIDAIARDQLGKRGFPPLPPQQQGKAPMIYVRLSLVTAGEDADAPISIYLTVQLKQWTILAHKSAACEMDETRVGAPLLVTTWERGTMVMMNRKELGFYVRQVLINLLWELAEDTKTANAQLHSPAPAK
jgi:hypothetical protein